MWDWVLNTPLVVIKIKQNNPILQLQRHFDVFIVKFEHISQLALMFSLLTLRK